MADVINRETLEVRRSVNASEYPYADWLILRQKNINREPADIPLEYCEIIGDEIAEVSPTDRQIIDAQKIEAAREAKKEQLTEQFTAAFDTHYTPDAQRALLSLLDIARSTNNAEMAEHIQKVQVWQIAGTALLFAAHDAVDAAPPAGIDAVGINLDDWEATDPKISIRELGDINGE